MLRFVCNLLCGLEMFKSIWMKYMKYLPSLEVEGHKLLRKVKKKNSWQLFYKGCHTFKPLSGQPFEHLIVHLLMSADNISVPCSHLHFHCTCLFTLMLKESNRFWCNKDGPTDVHLRYSVKFWQRLYCQQLQSLTYQQIQQASNQPRNMSRTKQNDKCSCVEEKLSHTVCLYL